jgi:Ni,Fe-hydrogenase III large subunit
VGRDLPADLDLAGEVGAALEDFEEIVALSLANTLVLDRLDGTGRLTTRTARDHGVLGYVARASGIDADVRRDHPFAAYGDLAFRVPVFHHGDVKARTLVRVEKARESVRLIREAIARMPNGAVDGPRSAPSGIRARVELRRGWRGAIVHWVMADGQGRLHRVKIMDPSFLNWRPLSYALLKNIVPDFPLCNKSLNLSYSGTDLTAAGILGP